MRTNPVIAPNLGLYLGRSPLTVPPRALQDGRNFRIKEGRLSNQNLGWNLHSDLTFDLPVTLIDNFVIRGTSQKQIVGTRRDLYEYDPSTDTALFLNRRYATGTVDVSSAAQAVVSVDTGTPNWQTNTIKAGDFISFGDAAERDPAATWYEIDSVDSESQLTLTGAVTGAPLSAQAYTIRRTFTGADDDVWSTEIFVHPDDGTGDDLWFASTGVDYVVTWDGNATEVVERSSLGFKAKRLAVYKNMMIYANLLMDSGEFLPSSYINSDVSKPLNAGDTGTGLSEQFVAHGGTDEIKEIATLGDYMVLYAERHVVLVQFVGDPLVFVQREAINGVGLIASRLIADFGDYHEFIAHDSQYLFDGVQVTEVGKQVWREIARLRDPMRHEMGFAHFDEENGDLIWVIALTSDAGVGTEGAPAEWAFVEHYLEEVGDRVPTPFSRRSFPFLCSGDGTTSGTLTWDELTGTWDDAVFRWNDSLLFAAFPITLAGDADGRIMHVNSAQTANGTSLESYVHFGRRATIDGEQRGLVARIYPFAAEHQGDLTVTTLLSDHPSGPNTISQQDAFDMTLPEGQHFVSPFRCGRFVESKFGTPGHAWEIEGYAMDVRPGGKR